MVTYQQIEKAVAEKIGVTKLPEGLLIFGLKPVGEDAAVFLVMVDRNDFPPLAQYIGPNEEGKIVVRPIPDWLAPYVW